MQKQINILLIDSIDGVLLRPKSPHRMNMLPLKGNEIWEDSDKYERCHLYFTSDDSIGDNEWFVAGDTVLKYRNENSLRFSGKNEKRKLIATTSHTLNLPTCSQIFLTRFVELYNSRKPLQRVMVEYWTKAHQSRELHGLSTDALSADRITYVPKLRGSEVVIHPVKDNFTREDAKVLCYNAMDHLMTIMSDNQQLSEEFLTDFCNQWFEKNY